MNTKYTAIVEKTDTGFSSYIDDLGVYTTGKSITELRNNLVEALGLLFEDSGKEIAPGNIEL